MKSKKHTQADPISVVEPQLRFPKFALVAGWRERQLGDVFYQRIDKGYPDKTVLSASQERGVIPYHLLEKSVFRDKRNLVGYKLVCKGDFVISLRSFEGGIEYSMYEGIISPAYVVLHPKERIHDEYFRVYFKSKAFIDAIRRSLNNQLRDGKSITYNQAKSIPIWVPEVNEQKAVADCFQPLDLLIASQEQALSALRAHKDGLLQQLIPNPEMR